MNKLILALCASLAFAGAASAQVTVTAPWVRATMPAMKSTGAFMQLQAAKDARLVGVTTPLARAGELHQMAMEGTTMKMQEVDSIALPAGKGVNLATGGYHIMLVDLKRQLKENETVPLTLVIEYKDKKRENVTVQVPVRPLTFVSPHSGSAAAH